MQVGTGYYRRHLFEIRGDSVKILADLSRLRVGAYRALEFGASGGIDFAVDLRVDKLVDTLFDHVTIAPAPAGLRAVPVVP